MSSRKNHLEPHVVQSNGFDHWRRSHPNYGPLKPLTFDQIQIHLALQDTFGGWYVDAGGLGFALDHVRVTFDAASGRDVYLLEPNAFQEGRRRSEAVARSRAALKAISVFSGLDILCLDTGFYSGFTLAFLLPVPTAKEMTHIRQLARDRRDARKLAA